MKIEYNQVTTSWNGYEPWKLIWKKYSVNPWKSEKEKKQQRNAVEPPMNGVETRRWIPRERGFQKKKENNGDEKCKKKWKN